VLVVVVVVVVVILGLLALGKTRTKGNPVGTGHSRLDGKDQNLPSER
jgi:hypothetical protein